MPPRKLAFPTFFHYSDIEVELVNPELASDGSHSGGRLNPGSQHPASRSAVSVNVVQGIEVNEEPLPLGWEACQTPFGYIYVDHTTHFTTKNRPSVKSECTCIISPSYANF